jgi:hypothetical protein
MKRTDEMKGKVKALTDLLGVSLPFDLLDTDGQSPQTPQSFVPGSQGAHSQASLPAPVAALVNENEDVRNVPASSVKDGHHNRHKERTDEMKSQTRVLAALLSVSLLFALTGCGGGGQPQKTPEPSGQDSQSAATEAPSFAPAPASANEDEEGRPLLYDANGIKVYASKVEFSTSNKEDSAKISVYYKIVNDSNENFVRSLDNLVVNGKSNARASGPKSYAAFTISSKSAMLDNDYSVLIIQATDFGLEVKQTADGKYQVDNSVAYSVSGDITDGLTGHDALGTFSFTIPANFPNDKFRADEKWVIN